MGNLTIRDVEDFCHGRFVAHKGCTACNQCPIHGVCTSGIERLTQESLDSWRGRCVEALSAVLGQRAVRPGHGGAVNG